MIAATVNVGNYTGTFNKTITVSTDSKDQPVTVLRITVIAPDVIKMVPQAASWKMDGPLTPQRVAITVLPAGCTLTAQSVHPAVKAKLQRLSQPNKYELVVTPTTTEGTFNSSVDLELSIPTASGKVTKLIKFHVAVQ